MAQARRKPAARRAGRAPRAASRAIAGNNRAAVALVLAGMAIGSLATLLWQGAARSPDSEVGVGIRQMIGRHGGGAVQESAPAGRPAKPALDFDFFTVLPEIEVVATPAAQTAAPSSSNTLVADQNGAAAARVAARSGRPGRQNAAARAHSGAFMLQAASYRQHTEAERLRANLALNGMASAIQKASIQGEGDFYRVRLGPYPSYQTMAAAHQQLADIGITAMTLKIIQNTPN